MTPVSAPAVEPSVAVPLGRILITRGAREAINHAKDSINRILDLHQSGNWGSVPYEDRIANDETLSTGKGRFVSLHRTRTHDQILLITENGVTKVMLPYEFGW